jgi:hypothetical protein
MAGWSTPRISAHGAMSLKPENALRRIAKFGRRGRIEEDVALAGWGTPTGQDGKHATLSTSEQNRDPNNLRNQVYLTGWNSPRSSDGSKGGPNQSGGALSHDATLVGWATPIDRDWKDTEGMSQTGINPDGSIRSRMDHLGRQAFLSTAKTEDTGGSRLNPAFSLWLIAGDSVTHELIATCPRGLVLSKQRGTRS